MVLMPTRLPTRRCARRAARRNRDRRSARAGSRGPRPSTISGRRRRGADQLGEQNGRAEVGEQRELLAQPQQAGAGRAGRGRQLVRRAADGAEQDRVRLARRAPASRRGSGTPAASTPGGADRRLASARAARPVAGQRAQHLHRLRRSPPARCRRRAAPRFSCALPLCSRCSRGRSGARTRRSRRPGAACRRSRRRRSAGIPWRTDRSRSVARAPSGSSRPSGRRDRPRCARRARPASCGEQRRAPPRPAARPAGGRS